MDTLLQPLISSLQEHDPKADVVKVERAYEVAKTAHSGQLRKSGDEYITHPVAVAHILSELGLNDSTIIAALLHDTVEDTPYSLAQLKSDLGYKQITYKTNDQSSNITAFADLTNLSFSVVSGKTYRFKIFCQFDVTNTSTGTRWAVNGPAFSRLFYNLIWTSGTGAQANLAYQTYDGPGATGNSNFTTNNCAIIEGIVVPSANGTLSARFACELTITSVTCKAGSFIEWEEI